jgi:hypothetical protein
LLGSQQLIRECPPRSGHVTSISVIAGPIILCTTDAALTGQHLSNTPFCVRKVLLDAL